MVELIMVMLAIVLTAGMLTAAANYLPTWQNTAEVTYQLSKKGFDTLEQSFQLKSKELAGEPASLVQADGGLSTLFQPFYGYLPKAPEGMAWKYGEIPGVPSTKYVCLYAVQPLSEGAVRGLYRLAKLYSVGDAIDAKISFNAGAGNCGGVNDGYVESNMPAYVSVTYKLKYIPGVY